MPVMDGEQATKAIRSFEAQQNRSKTPIVALTAHVMDSQREKFLDQGMDDHLAKPITKKSVADVLQKWVPAAFVDRGIRHLG